MSDDLRADARRLLHGITPGAWTYADVIERRHNVIDEGGWDVASCTGGSVAEVARREEYARGNAEFIAAAPALVSRLLGELDRVTLQRDQAIELGGDIDQLASASLQTLADQRNAATSTIQQVREYIERAEHPDDWGVKCVYTKDLRRILEGVGA